MVYASFANSSSIILLCPSQHKHNSTKRHCQYHVPGWSDYVHDKHDDRPCWRGLLMENLAVGLLIRPCTRLELLSNKHCDFVVDMRNR